MTSTLTFAYGDEKISLEFPDDFLAGEMLQPQSSSESLSEDQLIAKIDEALADPSGRPRLRDMAKGKSVALVISDEFRAGLQRLIMDRMLLEIHGGGPTRIGVFVSTGSHAIEYYAKNTIEWFHESCKRHGITGAEVFANDCDAPNHVLLGRTSLGSDVEIMTEFMEYEVRAYGHESKHHYMNGYSIIDKQISPGIATRKTIADTHKFALDSDNSLVGRNPSHTDPERRTNPFAQGCLDARHLSERFILRDGKLEEAEVGAFALDMISTQTSINWIMAGNPDEVCNRMTEAADGLAAFTVQKTKYVVISPGGPPACNAIYGVQNCFDMALKGAIENGGEALLLAPCLGRPDLPDDVRGLAPDEKSKKLFWENLCKFHKMPLQEALDHIDKNFELYLWKTDRVLKLMRKNNVKLYLYSELAPEIVEPGGFISVSDPQAWIEERAKRGDGQVRAINDGNKMLVIGK